LKYKSNPYDLGIIKNLKSVLGDEWWMWFLPVYTNYGDGTKFEIAIDSEDQGGLLSKTEEEAMELALTEPK
jgi:hypothetical protein